MPADGHEAANTLPAGWVLAVEPPGAAVVVWDPNKLPLNGALLDVVVEVWPKKPVEPPPKPPVLGVAVALAPNPANAPPLLKGDADAPGVPPKGPALALADAAPKAPDPPKGLVICAPTPPKGPLFCAPKGAVLCAAPNAADPPNVLEFGAAPEPPDPPNGPGA